MAYVKVKDSEAAAGGPSSRRTPAPKLVAMDGAAAVALEQDALAQAQAPADAEPLMLAGVQDGSEVESAVEQLDVVARYEKALGLISARDYPAAADLLDPVSLPRETDVTFQIAWAETLCDARAPETADMLFDRLLTDQPESREIRVAFAKRLHSRGMLRRALDVLEPVADTLAKGSRALLLYRRISSLVERFEELDGSPVSVDEDARLRALRHAIAHYRNREVRHLPANRIGRISLVTGSLGPGGAERQLTRTAAELETRRRRDGKVGAVAIERPLEVIVRSHGPENQHDFFLDDLRAADVEIYEINRMEQTRVVDFEIEDKGLVALLEFLPIKVNFGIRRLVRHFEQSNPDVVSIWQDGACLFAGLAAVMAGVPRIQLVIRGLPPVIRRHMFQPEYEVMYRALAEVPGVEFVSNSKAAARAYAEWLDLPIERFSIVYNGVQKMECREDEALDAQWEAFAAATPDADHTVGGVFRFDTDKRPLVWIRFAARYARQHPNSRFVLVGGGRLLDEAIALAEELEVRDRILFVGRSTDVGFWMKRMDVLLLMSGFEGLPNVLIEAQFLGVPVVSTPAGGAAECFIEGVTGHILGCADKTDLGETCEKVRALVGRAGDPAIFEPATRDFLDPNFSIQQMLEKFVSVTCGAKG